MIAESLTIINNALNHYLKNIKGSFLGDEMDTDLISKVGNVALLESGNPQDAAALKDMVITSLLRVEEEHALKNISNNRSYQGSVEYRNPKVNLNLYVIFVANYGQYIKSLWGLSHVIKYFQGKNVFTHLTEAIEDIDYGPFKITMELHTPGAEENNFIWGVLGGKQYPSVVYKARVIELERDLIKQTGKVIKGLDQNISNN